MRITSASGITVQLDSYVEFQSLVVKGIPYLELTNSGWATVVLVDGDVRYTIDINYDTPEYTDWQSRKPKLQPFARTAEDAQGRALSKAAGLESRTYGRFGVPGDAFDVPVGATVKRTYVLPFDVDLVDGTILLTGAVAGDVARFTVAPRTPLNAIVSPGNLVNVLAAPIAVGDKQITLIAPYLAAFVNVALVDAGLFEVVVTDGVNTDAYGPDAAPGEVRMPLNITGYDVETGMVTLGSIRIWSDDDTAPTWSGFEHDYTADAGTMVLVTRSLVPRVELDGVSALRVGEAARSAAPVKAGVPIVLEYTRSATATEATRVRVLFDVMTGQPEL